MPSLSQIQREFADQLDAGKLAEPLQEMFRGEPGLVKRRLAVYRGNVLANQSKALRGAYPVVAKIVGDEFFEGLAREYGRAFPSISGDLNEFGAELAHFLESFPPVAGLAYLPDVARLEWRVHRAFYAADKDKLDPVRFKEVPPAAQSMLCFRFHPACALLYSEFPLARIWEIHQDDFQGKFDLGANPRVGWVLVHRPQYRVAVSALTEEDAAFLLDAQRGVELEGALLSAQRINPDFDLSGRLAAWIAGNLIVDFSCALEPGAAQEEQDANTR